MDLFPLFLENPALLSDKIHPTSVGANKLAFRLYLDLTLYHEDGIHLKPLGYKAWALALEPELKRWLRQINLN